MQLLTIYYSIKAGFPHSYLQRIVPELKEAFPNAPIITTKGELLLQGYNHPIAILTVPIEDNKLIRQDIKKILIPFIQSVTDKTQPVFLQWPDGEVINITSEKDLKHDL